MTYENRERETGGKGFGHDGDIVKDEGKDGGEESSCPHDEDEGALAESLPLKIHDEMGSGRGGNGMWERRWVVLVCESSRCR